MISLTQIKYILAVDKERHFGQAAKSCAVSQPSLSLQLQKAEEEIGFLIFTRSAKRKIVPTEKGLQLIQQAKIVWREHKKMMSGAKAEEGVIAGRFSLAIIPTVLPYLVPTFIQSLAQQYPLLKLSIHERTTEEIISLLLAEELDAGILATPLKEKMIRERPLYYEEFILYASEGHDLLHKETVHPQDLHNRDIWILEDGHCLRNQVVSLCQLQKPKNVFQNISFEGGSLETLRQIILRNGGYTLIPKMFQTTLPASEQHLTRSFQTPPPTREISLVFNRHQWKQDILRALQEEIIRTLPADLPQQSANLTVIGL